MLVTEGNVVPEEDLLDGSWEAGSVLSKDFVDDVDLFIHEQRVGSVLRSSRAAVIAAIAALDGKLVRTTDVRVGKFT